MPQRPIARPISVSTISWIPSYGLGVSLNIDHFDSPPLQFAQLINSESMWFSVPLLWNLFPFNLVLQFQFMICYVFQFGIYSLWFSTYFYFIFLYKFFFSISPTNSSLSLNFNLVLDFYLSFLLNPPNKKIVFFFLYFYFILLH